MNVYDFKVTDNKGNQVDLAQYKGKVLLIINTATECGFTPQYADLEKLYKTYKDNGLEILDFPCDQFGHQAPGSSNDIATFCTGRFGVTFRQFAKIDVNGVNTLPLYAYLKSQKGFAGFRKEHPITPVLVKILSKADPDYEKKPDIKWNFTKFLIDRNGNVLQRFEPTEDLKVVEEAMKKAL